jgi:hypothetical protein
LREPPKHFEAFVQQTPYVSPVWVFVPSAGSDPSLDRCHGAAAHHIGVCRFTAMLQTIIIARMSRGEHQQDPTPEIHGHPRSHRRFAGVSGISVVRRSPLESRGVLRSVPESCGVSRSPAESCGVSRSLAESRGVLRSLAESRGITGISGASRSLPERTRST